MGGFGEAAIDKFRAKVGKVPVGMEAYQEEEDMMLMPPPPVPMRLPTNLFNEPTPTLALNLNGPQTVAPRVITAQASRLLPP